MAISAGTTAAKPTAKKEETVNTTEDIVTFTRSEWMSINNMITEKENKIDELHNKIVSNYKDTIDHYEEDLKTQRYTNSALLLVNFLIIGILVSKVLF